jgi:hypothetical protein
MNFKIEFMNSIQLKQELILQISRIEDIDILKAIKILLDYKKKDTFIQLTSSQEKELLFASTEAKNGNIISQLEMDQKVSEWLKEK